MLFSHSVMSSSLQPHELQHTRPPCPSPTPRVHSDSRPSSRWCHPAISSSVVPFSSCLQSFLASQSFIMSQFFASGGQSVGASASGSVLPMNIQNWFPLWLTGWISLQSMGSQRVRHDWVTELSSTEFLYCWVTREAQLRYEIYIFILEYVVCLHIVICQYP